MSMHAEYLRERLGDEVLEYDEGFVTYRFIDDNGIKSVYIVDIFVRPDFRRTRMASIMADAVVELARTQGCKRLIGTVSPASKNATDSLKVLMGYGMELYQCDKNAIIFKREI